MKIIFENKRPKESIVNDIGSCQTSTIFTMGESFLFQGDNFIGMSEILKLYKGFT